MRIGQRLWRCSWPHGRDVVTRGETIESFWKHCITSRSTTSRGGPCLPSSAWNSVWKRFWRLSQSGVFEAFFEALAAMSTTAHLVQMFDSTVVRAHVSAAGAKGGKMIRLSVAHAVDFRLPSCFPLGIVHVFP